MVTRWIVARTREASSPSGSTNASRTRREYTGHMRRSTRAAA
ncbi:MAG: hypothetical protein ACRDPC_20755 [Solirubrobacteraceae bacterium]